MKATGSVRQIDKLGRLVLPSDIRKALDITAGVDSVEIFSDGDSVILKKYTHACIFCGNDEDIVFFGGHALCHDCLEKLHHFEG